MVGSLFLASILVGLVALHVGRACLRHHAEQASHARRCQYRAALVTADADALALAMVDVALSPDAQADMVAAIDTAGAMSPRTQAALRAAATDTGAARALVQILHDSDTTSGSRAGVLVSRLRLWPQGTMTAAPVNL